jgi:hypothetical protein
MRCGGLAVVAQPPQGRKADRLYPNGMVHSAHSAQAEPSGVHLNMISSSPMGSSPEAALAQSATHANAHHPTAHTPPAAAAAQPALPKSAAAAAPAGTQQAAAARWEAGILPVSQT